MHCLAYCFKTVIEWTRFLEFHTVVCVKVFRFSIILLFWYLMEEEIISLHCAMAWWFYCRREPPTSRSRWLWEVMTSWIYTLKAVEGLPQCQFWDMGNFLIQYMQWMTQHNGLNWCFYKQTQSRTDFFLNCQASSIESWIQTFFLNLNFFHFSELELYNLMCTKKK